MEDATVIFRSEAPQQLNIGEAFDAGVLPTWTEAVALIRAVAWQLYREGSTAPVPDLGDIALFSTGAVHLEGGEACSEGQVAGIGAVMGQLLEHVSAPPQVMDVQRQAMVVPPVYATLMEFHNALDFFARPDSKAVLADYHKRAMAALEQTEHNQALEELKEKTKAAPQEKEKEETGTQKYSCVDDRRCCSGRVEPRWCGCFLPDGWAVGVITGATVRQRGTHRDQRGRTEGSGRDDERREQADWRSERSRPTNESPANVLGARAADCREARANTYRRPD